MTNWSIPDLWDGKDAVFLVTEMSENERLVQDLARAQAQHNACAFDGQRPAVYHKLLYVPPYETFTGLRQLSAQILADTGLRACFRGIVALDLSEWLGHETDEYLKITFKYLHDHRNGWKLLFLAGNCPAQRLSPLVQAAAPYLRLRRRQLCLFRDVDLLGRYIAANLPADRNACRLLTEVCMRTPALHDCAALEQIFGDLAPEPGKRVTTRQLREYFQDDSSLPAMLGVQAPALTEQGETEHEQRMPTL